MEEVSGIYLASGSRKTAVARVKLRVGGRGRIYVNGQRPSEYFKREDLVQHALEPLKVTRGEGDLDVVAKVRGGGMSGQAGALRLALARALCELDASVREVLKKYGMLTRDPREKERMKYGRAKRRKAPQYSKR